jgi:hypothetical protein
LRKTVSALLGLLFLLAFPGAVLAANPQQQGITASPPIQRLELQPGAVFSGSVDISDPGKTEYDFTASAAPFSVKGEEYDLQYASRPDLVDASRWFTFPTTKYHLKPGQKVSVQYKVTVPKDIAGGGYYAVVFAQADPLPGTGVTGQKRVGVLTYMTVAGDIIRQGRVAGFGVPWIQTQPPLHAEVRIQNTGNVHFDSSISLQIKDLFGNVKGEIEADHVIFPKTTRLVALDWKTAPSFGLYHLGGTVKYLGSTEQLPSRWTLMLSANAFLGLAGVLLAIGLFAFLTRRSRGNVRRG